MSIWNRKYQSPMPSEFEHGVNHYISPSPSSLGRKMANEMVDRSGAVDKSDTARFFLQNAEHSFQGAWGPANLSSLSSRVTPELVSGINNEHQVKSQSEKRPQQPRRSHVKKFRVCRISLDNPRYGQESMWDISSESPFPASRMWDLATNKPRTEIICTIGFPGKMVVNTTKPFMKNPELIIFVNCVTGAIGIESRLSAPGRWNMDHPNVQIIAGDRKKFYLPPGDDFFFSVDPDGPPEQWWTINFLWDPTWVEIVKRNVKWSPGHYLTPPSYGRDPVSESELPFYEMGELGRGGLARVAKVMDFETGAIFAVKGRVGEREVEQEQIDTEISVLELFNDIGGHANIIKTLGVIFTKHGNEIILPMMVFSVEDGLHARRFQATDDSKAVITHRSHFILLAQQMISALAFLEKTGIVHRDIKPGNILCSNTGKKLANTDSPEFQFMLADFGCAKYVGEPDDMSGTPRFLAPERIYGLELTPKSDVYSMCCAFHVFWRAGSASPGTNKSLVQLSSDMREQWRRTKGAGWLNEMGRIRPDMRSLASDLVLQAKALEVASFEMAVRQPRDKDFESIVNKASAFAIFVREDMRFDVTASSNHSTITSSSMASDSFQGMFKSPSVVGDTNTSVMVSGSAGLEWKPEVRTGDFTVFTTEMEMETVSDGKRKQWDVEDLSYRPTREVRVRTSYVGPQLRRWRVE